MENSKYLDLKNIATVGVVVTYLVINLYGCSDPIDVGPKFLNKPPSSGVNKDSIFATADRAKQFLFYAYRSLPFGPGPYNGSYDSNQIQTDVLASLTDINQDSWGARGAQKHYYQATKVPYSGGQTKYNFDGSGAWNGIRQAYIFINNISQVPDISVAMKKRLKAEARMIIALHYTDLFRNFGGVPWVDHAYSANEELKVQRMTARATLDSTVAMIDRAIPNLPFSLDKPDQDFGRFTQAGAMGLKCRALLFGASPLFNSTKPYMQSEAADQKLVWYGKKYSSLWKKAKDACGTLVQKVQSNGSYQLANTGHPLQDFRHAYYDRNSPELLISTTNGLYGGLKYSTLADNGIVTTTDNYVKMFPMADGTPINASGSNYDPQHPYKNRDPRLYETVLTNGENYQKRTAELYIGGRERPKEITKGTRTGYRMYKFLLDINSSKGAVTQWPYLRLPEIYLSYAEAINEVNGGPTAEAYKWVNKVRNRVGLKDLRTSLSESNLTQKEFRRVLLRERARELGYENVRWYDMIRWKRKDIFTKKLYGMNICKKGVTPNGICYGDYGSNTYKYDRFALPTYSWKENWSPKWFLSAFPRDEVLENDWVQNPR